MLGLGLGSDFTENRRQWLGGRREKNPNLQNCQLGDEDGGSGAQFDRICRLNSLESVALTRSAVGRNHMWKGQVAVRWGEVWPELTEVMPLVDTGAYDCGC